MPILVSVNLGRPERLSGRKAPSGIHKGPRQGPVAVGPYGLEGDAVLNRKHHGGPDQAVYVYLKSDYDWWSAQLGKSLEPGTFGDNLTITGLDGGALSVGDRLTIGPVELEITSHRKPCATLAAHMGDPGFVRRFHQAHRPGAYLRVLRPGSVEAGMAVLHTPWRGAPVRLTELVDTDGLRTLDPALMHRALAAPLNLRLRSDFERRLAAAARSLTTTTTQRSEPRDLLRHHRRA